MLGEGVEVFVSAVRYSSFWDKNSAQRPKERERARCFFSGDSEWARTGTADTQVQCYMNWNSWLSLKKVHEQLEPILHWSNSYQSRENIVRTWKTTKLSTRLDICNLFTQISEWRSSWTSKAIQQFFCSGSRFFKPDPIGSLPFWTKQIIIYLQNSHLNLSFS